MNEQSKCEQRPPTSDWWLQKIFAKCREWSTLSLMSLVCFCFSFSFTVCLPLSTTSHLSLEFHPVHAISAGTWLVGWSCWQMKSLSLTHLDEIERQATTPTIITNDPHVRKVCIEKKWSQSYLFSRFLSCRLSLLCFRLKTILIKYVICM